jgi:hypothetical protein
LTRVLSADSTRARSATELDFFGQDIRQRAEVEVTLGDLQTDGEQMFLDHLEVWDRKAADLVDELADPALIDRQQYELVVRLCYRISWIPEEDQADHWVDYAKSSDPDAGIIDRVGRQEREWMPFANVQPRVRVLDLGSRGGFRRLVESTSGNDFAQAVGNLEDEIERLAGEFSHSAQMSSALDRIVDPVRLPIAVPAGTAAADLVRFLPEGGSMTGLIRSLSPSLDLQDGQGALPLARQGSTVEAMLGTAEAWATAGSGGIVIGDDFGEYLDAGSAQHLAAVMRQSSGQVWLSTRRAAVADAFELEEVTRLSKAPAGRSVAYGRNPTSKPERIATRAISIQIFPALTSRAVVTVEGPHDRAALTAVALKMQREANIALPSAHRISLIDAGVTDGSGGSSSVPRLSRAAREFGLFTIGVIDQDAPGQQTDAELAENLAAADAVIRFPTRCAIEYALLQGLDPDLVKQIVQQFAGEFGFTLEPGFAALQDNAVRSAVSKILKKQNLHAQFVQALPINVFPALVQRALKEVVRVASGRITGHVQL